MSKPQMPQDPNFTLDVNNTAIEDLIVKFNEDKTIPVLNQLVGSIHHSRVLAPVTLGDNKQPQPIFIKNQEGQVFMPIYTSKGHIPQLPKGQGIINIPFLGVNEVALRPELKVVGIVINPQTTNFVLKRELLEKIAEVEEKQKNAPKQQTPASGIKKVEMTEAEYVIFERRQFEGIFLPKKLWENSAEFVANLMERREEFIDELFEESYQQKRMYPYLTEEFSVMPMDISDEQLVIRLDMPEHDLGNGVAVRLYFNWDKKKKTARYFVIELAAQNRLLSEITEEMNRTIHGVAPEEGAELSRILEIVAH